LLAVPLQAAHFHLRCLQLVGALFQGLFELRYLGFPRVL
jgi:hypothetical protein